MVSASEEYFYTVFLPHYRKQYPHAALSETDEKNLLDALIDSQVSYHSDIDWIHAISSVWNMNDAPYELVAFVRSVVAWSAVRQLFLKLSEHHLKKYFEDKLPATRSSQANDDVNFIVTGNPYLKGSDIKQNLKRVQWILRQYPSNTFSPYTKPGSVETALSERGKFPAEDSAQFTEAVKQEQELLQSWNGYVPRGMTYETVPETVWFPMLENCTWKATRNFLLTMPHDAVIRYLGTLKGQSRFRIYRDIQFVLEREDYKNYPEEWLTVFTE